MNQRVTTHRLLMATRVRWAALHAGLSALVAWMVASVPVHGQAEQHWIDDPRPLSKAIETIETRCRCVITYEDPRYDAIQVEDVTEQVRRDGSSTVRVHIPKGSPFGFTYAAPAAIRGPEDLVPAVQALLDAFHLSGNSNTSRFRLDRSDAVLHVMPAKGSILQVPVSIPDTEAAADQLIAVFVTAVSKATGMRVLGGGGPTNHLRQSVVRAAADNEPAQQVLTVFCGRRGEK